MAYSEGLGHDPELSRLPLGLNRSKHFYSLNPVVLAEAIPEVFSRGNHGNEATVNSPCADFCLTSLGELPVVASRQTPSIINEDEDSRSSTLAVCLAGDEVQYKEGKIERKIRAQSAFLNPRHGGIATTGYLSGIYCQINHERLNQTIQTIDPRQKPLALDQPFIFQPGEQSKESCFSSDIIAFFTFVNSLLTESQSLPAELCLEDTIYRMLALSLLKKSRSAPPRSTPNLKNWNWELDELVDYIKANSHLPLSMTDLEAVSHYSARHLQYTFKEKLGCSPMQFLRNQRLSKAMERLQKAEMQLTVTEVARECGYTNTQQFSKAFQKRFGVKPSTILRASL